MSKQEFMKVQTCVLRVNIQCVCDGCEQKIRKSLQKIEGVSSVSIDAEQGKVTVSGCFGDPAKLIKKLQKSGKHAELWGFQKGPSSQKNNNQAQFNQQFMKNIQVSDKNSNNNKSQKGFGKDQSKDITKANGKKDPNNKSVKFSDRVDQQGFASSDGEFDDDFDGEFDDDDEDYDDEDDYSDEDEEFGHGHNHSLPNKAMQGNGLGPQGQYGANGPYGPKGMVVNDKKGMTGPYGPKGMAVNDKKVAAFGGPPKKGGVIDFPIEGKKKSEGKGQKQGGHGHGDKKKKNGGGGGGGGGLRGLFGFGKKSVKKESLAKKGNNNHGGHSGDEKKNKPGNNGKKNDTKGKNDGGKTKNEFEIDFGAGGGKGGKGGAGAGGKGGKGGGGGGNMGPMGPMGPPGHGGMGPRGMSMGPGPMGNNYSMGGLPAVQGLPAQAMMSGGGYYNQGMGPGPGYAGPGNPYAQQQQLQQQQQYMAMMMSQQRGNGNDMFQPMMYSRPHLAVNYASGPPHPHPANDNLTHFFSDENTESCSIM